VPRLSQPPSSLQPGTAHLLHALHLILDEDFGPLHHAGKHPDTVDEQAAIGGMMDRGLHTGGIEPQLASFGHLGLRRQLHHAIIECMQRFGT